jgi:hypothetical protein
MTTTKVCRYKFPAFIHCWAVFFFFLFGLWPEKNVSKGTTSPFDIFPQLKVLRCFQNRILWKMLRYINTFSNSLVDDYSFFLRVTFASEPHCSRALLDNFEQTSIWPVSLDTNTSLCASYSSKRIRPHSTAICVLIVLKM